MKHTKISLCYHPTTVVLIDDNKDYLTQLQIALNEKIVWKPYNDPFKALNFLNNTYHNRLLSQRFVVNPEDIRADCLVSEVDIRSIKNEAKHDGRFEEIAIILVDYTMPGMNGIELSMQLKNSDIFVVLLTGEADNDVAVQAFNAGIIDKFIKKTTPDLIPMLLNMIQELEKQYFMEQSNVLFNRLSFDVFACLEDRSVKTCFQQLYQANNIVEYYLLNSNGSYLFLDRDGKPSWFVLMSEKELNNFYEYAQDSQASDDIIQDLKNKSHIPFFFTDEELVIPPEEWRNYLYPAELLIGQNKYYYAYITQLKCYDNSYNNVRSYNDYLASV